MNAPVVKLSFIIPAKVHRNLRALCSDKKVSMREFIHKLIVQEIKKNENHV